MAETKNFVGRLKVPIAMIHSAHDEWDPIEKSKILFSLSPEPKQFLAVEAANHRFSDKVSEVLSDIERFLRWMEKPLQQEWGAGNPAAHY